MSLRTIMTNNLVCTLYVCAVHLVAGLTSVADMVRPENFIKLTAFNQKVVLIEITKVDLKSLEIDKGIETREVTITSKIVETIRGNDSEQDFTFSDNEYRIVDKDKAKAENPSNLFHILKNPNPHQASSCLVGHWYLVIYMENLTFFYEVSKNDDSWRSQILEYREP